MRVLRRENHTVDILLDDRHRAFMAASLLINIKRLDNPLFGHMLLANISGLNIGRSSVNLSQG